MKKAKKLLPLLLLCFALSACGENPVPVETPNPTDIASEESANMPEETANVITAQPEESSAPAAEDWKQAYADYLRDQATELSNELYPIRYTLIYLDDDNIPEIADIGSAEAEGSRILHYANGEVHETQLRRLHFTYIPRGNLLLNNEGNMGHYTANVLSIIDGEMTFVASGTEDELEPRELDENGLPKSVYTWDGVAVSREEYAAALAAVYDEAQAVEALNYEAENYGLFTAEEIIEQINAL